MKEENKDDAELSALVSATTMELEQMEAQLEDPGIETLEDFIRRSRMYLQRLRDYTSEEQ